jgi:hypothetical protein
VFRQLSRFAADFLYMGVGWIEVFGEHASCKRVKQEWAGTAEKARDGALKAG